MKLIDRIRIDREQQKGKKALPETVFTAVAAVVKKFDLKAVPAAEVHGGGGLEGEPVARLGLFPLLTAAQWHLTQEIIAKFDNPYLVYVRSPEDFGVSLRLSGRNPDLQAESLQQYSLGWLLSVEAKGEGRG
jgi:hypothetical protein